MNRVLSKFASVALLILIVFNSGKGQPAPSFYPLHVGDFWIYWDYAWGVSGVWDTLTTIITQDSLIAGRTYYVTNGRSARYGNTWTRFERIDPSGDVFLYDPGTKIESLEYRLSDTSKTWWDGMMQRFDSCRVQNVFGGDRSVLYVGAYVVDSTSHDTTLQNTRILINDIGFYYSVPAGIIDGGPTILAGGKVGGTTFGLVISVNSRPAGLPATFVLSEPFPNPFNPTTILELSIPNRTRVRLDIVDLLGTAVSVLLDQELDAGVYRVPWDATRQASGMYFCRMAAGGRMLTRRLLLLK